MMKKIVYLLATLLLQTACVTGDLVEESDSSNKPISGPFERTVLVYMSGENSLGSYIDEELEEMRKGSIGTGYNALMVYVDRPSKSQKPYLQKICNGIKYEPVTMDSDLLASHPATMSHVLQLTKELCPAQDYGLVLWGHGSGWIMEDSVDTDVTAARRQGYGVDNGQNSMSNTGKWMNMWTLAQVLQQWDVPLRFILADCCQFQCVEGLYELRYAADYIIGSPAEIPAEGAPYTTVVKAMMSQDEQFYEAIVDAYYAQVIDGLRVPLSAVKTSALDSLASVTRRTLAKFALPAGSCPDLHGLVYYKGAEDMRASDTMYDMNDFMLHYAPEADYVVWKRAFDDAVVCRRSASEWISSNGFRGKQIDFSSFEMTDERYGGMSMYVPQRREASSYRRYANDIKKTSWYWAAGLSEVGW